MIFNLGQLVYVNQYNKITPGIIIGEKAATTNHYTYNPYSYWVYFLDHKDQKTGKLDWISDYNISYAKKEDKATPKITGGKKLFYGKFAIPVVNPIFEPDKESIREFFDLYGKEVDESDLLKYLINIDNINKKSQPQKETV